MKINKASIIIITYQHSRCIHTTLGQAYIGKSLTLYKTLSYDLHKNYVNFFNCNFEGIKKLSSNKNVFILSLEKNNEKNKSRTA